MSQIISPGFVSFLSQTAFKGVTICAPLTVQVMWNFLKGSSGLSSVRHWRFQAAPDLPYPLCDVWARRGAGMSSIRHWQWELQCGYNPKEPVGFLGMWARVSHPYPHPVTVNRGFGTKCFFVSSAGSGWGHWLLSCLQECRSALLLWPVSIKGGLPGMLSAFYLDCVWLALCIKWGKNSSSTLGCYSLGYAKVLEKVGR